MSQYATADRWQREGPTELIASKTKSEKNEPLKSASGQIDDALRLRYSLPLSEPYPESVVVNTIKIATYELLSSVGYSPNEYDDNYRLRYEDAVRWMKSVSKGELILPLNVVVVAKPQGGAGIVSEPRRGWQ